MAFLPNTTSRVTLSTGRKTNERIREAACKNVEQYSGADPETLSRRLEELDREWDVERMIETGASAQILLGLVLGFGVDRRWFGWSLFVAASLLVHALFGWFPVLPALRAAGFRTEAEIEEERDALRILRGDYTPTGDPLQAMAQARLSLGPSMSGASLADTK